jgi:preprotein translocase subunit SecY
MSTELKNRILFTLFILLIYRIGTFIPLPGIDSEIIANFFSESSNSIFSMINMFSGGAFQRMSIFALNIMPSITASIIIQLLASVYKSLEELHKDGEAGKRKINQYTKYLTLVLGFFQSLAIYFTFLNMEKSAFINTSRVFMWTTVFSLLASTMFLMWLGDKITNQGMGNGISIIIATGIIAELPGDLISIFQAAKNSPYSWVFVFCLLFLLGALILFVVYFEQSTREVKVQYSNKVVVKGQNQPASFIPLKLNMSGVIPPIFASSLLMFPAIILQFFGNSSLAQKFSSFLTRGNLLYTVIFSILIIFFSFFYSSIVFNIEELGENLKKSNCFVAGIRPGKNTVDYFSAIINRLTLIGAIYLILVCVIPDVLFTKYSIQLSIGGTSLLIIVSTVIDLIARFQSYSFSEKYSNVGKRRKIRVR